jgi:hypothetical protein
MSNRGRWSRRVVLSFAWYCCVATAPASAQFTTVLNIPPDPDIGHFQSIGAGTQLNVFDDGFVGTFFGAGATDGTSTYVEVNIYGGVVGANFLAHSGSMVNISGGSVVGFWQAIDDVVVNISSGTLSSLEAIDDSVVNISGGRLSNGLGLLGSVANISGGEVGTIGSLRGGVSVGDLYGDFGDSSVTISGGKLGGSFSVYNGCEANLLGIQFILDGSDITSTLTPNVTLTITARERTLSGLLADGSPFSFDLIGGYTLGADYFDPGATLTVMLVSENVPEPGGAMAGVLAGLVLSAGSTRRRAALNGT